MLRLTFVLLVLASVNAVGSVIGRSTDVTAFVSCTAYPEDSMPIHGSVSGAMSTVTSASVSLLCPPPFRPNSASVDATHLSFRATYQDATDRNSMVFTAQGSSDLTLALPGDMEGFVEVVIAGRYSPCNSNWPVPAGGVSITGPAALEFDETFRAFCYGEINPAQYTIRSATFSTQSIGPSYTVRSSYAAQSAWNQTAIWDWTYTFDGRFVLVPEPAPAFMCLLAIGSVVTMLKVPRRP